MLKDKVNLLQKKEIEAIEKKKAQRLDELMLEGKGFFEISQDEQYNSLDREIVRIENEIEAMSIQEQFDFLMQNNQEIVFDERDIEQGVDRDVNYLSNNAKDRYHLDSKRMIERQKEMSIKGIDDIILVHKTDYISEGGKLETAKSGGRMLESTREIGGMTYKLEYKSGRDTLHLSANAEVAKHKMGDWNNKKYAILIPGKDMPTEQLVGGKPADLIFRGNISIPQNSYILCPENEIEQMKKQGTNAKIMGYRGESVTGYADLLLQALGYKKEKFLGDETWENTEDNKVFNKIIREKGAIEGLVHFGSTDAIMDEKETNTNIINSLLNLIKDQTIINDDSLRKKLLVSFGNNMNSEGRRRLLECLQREGTGIGIQIPETEVSIDEFLEEAFSQSEKTEQVKFGEKDFLDVYENVEIPKGIIRDLREKTEDKEMDNDGSELFE